MIGPDRFESEKPPAAKIGSFRIGSALVVIALVAVSMGAMRASLPLGILLAASVVPAAVLTALVSDHRRAEGRPMGTNDLAEFFVLALLNVFVVLIASSIAFCVTCVPISLMGMHGEFQVDDKAMMLAVSLGGLAALGAGWMVAMGLIKASRSRQARARERGEP